MPTTEQENHRIYLTDVHLKGFKSIEDLTTDLNRGLNILIGKNGAGKSNFLEFLNQIINIRDNSNVVFKYASLQFHSNDNHSYVFETEREMTIRNGHEYSKDKRGVSETFIKDGNLVYNELTERIRFKDPTISYTGHPAGFFRDWSFVNLNPSYIRFNLPINLEFVDSPGLIKIEIEKSGFYLDFSNSLPFLTDIFYGLEEHFSASNEQELRNADKQVVLQKLLIREDIKYNLSRFSPIEDLKFNSNINTYTDGKSIIIENIKLDFKVNDRWLPWSQLSDGTRRIFYIISEVTYNTGLVLIEEPELGIHPHQFHLLMDFLKEQSEDKQIILSTHAPKALDHLSPKELENVLIAYYDHDKGTQIRHLTKKEQEKAKRYMNEVGFFSDYWMHSDLE